MGWKNHPPTPPTAVFLETETVGNMLNQDLHTHYPTRLHNMDDRSDAVLRKRPPALNPTLENMFRDPNLYISND